MIEQSNNYIENNIHKVNRKYKPQFHLSSPIGWINDPNGFSYYKNQYHLFYQYHPYSTKWGPMHWGHSVTKDLLHFEHKGVALSPKELKPDGDACFSGGAMVEDDELYLMYTVNEPNRQSQILAKTKEGDIFINIDETKFDASILPPELSVPLQDFRDPFIFTKDGIYYALLVALNLNEEVGMVILLESKDKLKWKYKSTVLKGDKSQGRMWECPILLRLDGYDVICVSIQDTPSRGFKYRNVTSSMYYLGQLDLKKGEFNVSYYDELDAGFGYYANQALSHKNKHYLISWLETATRSIVLDDLNHHWCGVFSLPRELYVKNGRLFQKPLETLSKHLQEVNSIEGVKSFKVHCKNALNDSFELKICNEHEEVILSFDDRKLTMNRKNSGILPTYNHSLDDNSNLRGLEIEEVRILDIYYDVSIMEVFVNGGEYTITSKLYPRSPYNKIECSNSDIEMKIMKYKKPTT